ncbi:ORC-CDC6 family AAA ATPase [Segeticoccus rhizosphaerae]|uniref:ORC-CDC6 family AAA ATPase n=1 Tax=Segeticoccus rhizosphaerae TaxID=1104777 RepID=UPI0010C14FDE|nr:hypothetical protein [Ornithinicoccus soli]
MTNPFEKRATEYLSDNEAFLAVVTPEPLITFFKQPATDGSLYDRLAIVTGTPGSGKTTLARLFEYDTVHSLLRNRNASTYRSLADALTQCGVLSNLAPQILGARVPLESEYRDFWEFPYPEETRMSLTSRLLEARSVIRWLRQLSDSGVAMSEVEIIPRAGAEAALELIGGRTGTAVLQKAREVELALYKVVRALVPPALASLEAAASDAYHPFDVIKAISFPWANENAVVTPLAMFDDAHSLHPIQYERLERWLTQREMRIGRWILTRLDALKPARVLGQEGDPDVQKLRVTTEIRMQPVERRTTRPAFRKMAKDMSNRYLRQIEAFNRRSLTNFSDLLATEPASLPDKKLAELAQQVDVVQGYVGASESQRHELQDRVQDYLASSSTNRSTPELVLAATAIALQRFGKRTPQLALDMFGEDLEPHKPITVDASLMDGARVHLLHHWRVPYYFGFDALCDASSENAEQFLQLAGRLVTQSETQLVRGKRAQLSANEQHRLISERSLEIVNSWDFPQHMEVRALTDLIAKQCVERSLEGNASLGGGPNAWGIPQEQFEALPSCQPRLARVLQFAVAYNALVLKTDHSTKNRLWCLLELGGPVAVANGLTLRRGGFLERDVKDLLNGIRASGNA